MNIDLLPLIGQLLEYTLVLSAQLVLVLVLRKPVGRWLGAVNAYRLWLLPLLWLPAYLLDWPWLDPASWRLPDADGAAADGLALVPVNGPYLGDFAMPDVSVLVSGQTGSPTLWLAGAGLWFAGVVWLLGREFRAVQEFNRLVQAGACDHAEARGQERAPVFPADVPVSYLESLDSPALLGVFRPRLLLPKHFHSHFDADQRHIMLAHEAVHLRRHDNLWNVFACLLRTVFWFNPLVAVAHRYFRLDQELSCDARALEACNGAQSVRYARTLVETIENARIPRRPPIIAAWENPSELRERITMIHHHITVKTGAGKALTSLLVLTLMGAVLTAAISPTISTPVVAAETEQRPPPGRPGERVSTRFVEQIDQVVALRDSGDFAGALEILDDLQASIGQGRLNISEQIVLWSQYAYVYQGQGEIGAATDAFNEVVNIPDLRPGQRGQALHSLGLFHLSNQQYAQAIDAFEAYNDLFETPLIPDPTYLIAVAYNGLGQYDAAVPYMLQYMDLLRQAGHEVDRSNYEFLRALYAQQNKHAEAMALTRDMIELFDQQQDRDLLANYLDLQAQGGAGGVDVVVEAIEQGAGFVPASSRPADDLKAMMEVIPVHAVAPKYPRRALARDIGGWALVGLTVTGDGKVKDPFIIDSEPTAIFDQVSLEAVEQFEFEPQIVDGEAVEVEGVRYLFRFNPEKE